MNYISTAKDDLSNESLARQELSLKSSDFASKLLAKCYAEPSFNVKEESRKSMDSLKNSFSYWSAIGSCYLHRNEPHKALFFYKISNSKASKSYQKAIYFNNLGVYYTKVNRLNLAIDQFNQSSKEDRNYKTPHMNLAMIYTQYGLNDKAKIELSHFRGSKDPHIIYLNKIVNSKKDTSDFFPSYLTEEDKKNTITKVYKK
jgi:tetratricopeptide (TPR) repeat protein